MKTLPFLLVALLITGCASARMDVRDLDSFQVDCANKDAQIRFLESQLTTQNERIYYAMTQSWQVELFNKMRGQDTVRAAMKRREYDAIVKVKVWNLKTYCPDRVAQ